MREIKFRAMKDDISNSQFVYGCLIYDIDGITPRIQAANPHEILFYTCIKGTEGQYTGLKDKNGREIYEGDIITGISASKNVKGDIDFVYGSFGIEDYNLHEIGSVEVIGNIYENPELLSK